MTSKIVRHLLMPVMVFLVLFGFVRTGRADSIKAFSLREANRQLKGGKSDNKELATLGGITRVAGMVFDHDSGDVILIGKVRSDMPPASLDDLVVALRSRLRKGQFPKVSIDMVEETAKTGMQDVNFVGGIEETKFGSDFLDSDIILKRYSLDLLRRIKVREAPVPPQPRIIGIRSTRERGATR